MLRAFGGLFHTYLKWTPWVVDLIQELAELGFMAGMAYTFRPKRFDALFYQVPRVTDAALEAQRRRNERRHGFGDAPARPQTIAPFHTVTMGPDGAPLTWAEVTQVYLSAPELQVP